MKHHLHRLFPKDEVEHAAAFRILQQQDFEMEEFNEDGIVPPCAACFPSAWAAR